MPPAIAYTHDTPPTWAVVTRHASSADQIDALSDHPTCDVRVYLAPPSPEHAAAVAPWLSPDERTRRDGFSHQGALAQFLSARWLLRAALAATLDQAPASVRITLTERGALVLPDAPGLHVNLTHTNDLVGVALARTPIGIDLETIARQTRDESLVPLAKRYFAPSEQAALMALPPAEQRLRFFRYWTLKEAYIKARGQGMAIPLAQFSFDLDATPPTFATSPEIAAHDVPATAWRFASWHPSPTHLIALALQNALT